VLLFESVLVPIVVGASFLAAVALALIDPFGFDKKRP
jgi:hypothetical protein